MCSIYTSMPYVAQKWAFKLCLTRAALHLDKSSTSCSAASHFEFQQPFETSAPNDPTMILNITRIKVTHICHPQASQISISFTLSCYGHPLFELRPILRKVHYDPKMTLNTKGLKCPIYVILISPPPHPFESQISIHFVLQAAVVWVCEESQNHLEHCNVKGTPHIILLPPMPKFSISFVLRPAVSELHGILRKF